MTYPYFELSSCSPIEWIEALELSEMSGAKHEHAEDSCDVIHSFIPTQKIWHT